MNNKFFKILISVLLMACLTAIFVACDPDDDDITTDQRENAILCLENQIVQSLDSTWSNNMSVENVATLSNAGDYYTACSWAKFIANIVDESGLQTAKIDNLTSFISSEEGRAMVGGEAVKILNLIKTAGLTSTDAEGLIYGALLSFLENGDSVYSGAIKSIGDISTRTDLSGEARQNLENNLAQLKASKTSFANTVLDRQNAITELKSAENEIKTLVSFIFNNAMLFNTDSNMGLFESISSGTLEDITAGEMATYLGAIIDSVKEVEDNLSGMTDDLMGAINSVLDVCDNLYINNETILGVIAVLENNASLPALIPILGDMAKNLESIYLGEGDGYAHLNEILPCIQDEYYADNGKVGANEYIGYFRIGLAFAGIDYKATGDTLTAQKQSGKALVKALADEILGGRNNASKINAISLVMSLNASGNTPVGGVELKRFSEIAVADAYLKSLKDLFKAHSLGIVDNSIPLYQTAEVLMRFVTGNDVVTIEGNYTKAWFDDLCAQVENKMASEIAVCYPVAKADIDERIDDIFLSTIDKGIAIALKTPVKVNDAGYDAFDTEVEDMYKEILVEIYGIKESE